MLLDFFLKCLNQEHVFILKVWLQANFSNLLYYVFVPFFPYNMLFHQPLEFASTMTWDLNSSTKRPSKEWKFKILHCLYIQRIFTYNKLEVEL